MSLEQRITDLEMRLAFQDDTIQSLSDELITQQRDLERLQAQMAALLKRQEEANSQFQISEQQELPPHY